MVAIPGLDRVAGVVGLINTMVRGGVIAPMRPDKYLKVMAAAQREGLSVTSGFAMSAQRAPERVALIDELGELTYAEVDRRADALASALQQRGAACEPCEPHGCASRGAVAAIQRSHRPCASSAARQSRWTWSP